MDRDRNRCKCIFFFVHLPVLPMKQFNLLCFNFSPSFNFFQFSSPPTLPNWPASFWCEGQWAERQRWRTNILSSAGTWPAAPRKIATGWGSTAVGDPRRRLCASPQSTDQTAQRRRRAADIRRRYLNKVRSAAEESNERREKKCNATFYSQMI